MADSRRPLVVVVSHDRHLSEILKSQLEAGEVEVHTEERGTSAIYYVTDHRPHLVVLDANLPDLDVRKACQELRRFYRPSDVPVLVMTGTEQPIDELRRRAPKADFYLTHPREPSELLGAVSLLLGRPVPS